MSQETLSPQPRDAEIPATAILNLAMAEAMADAEKPYLEAIADLGTVATTLGLKTEADEQASKADQAGFTAGELFIEAEQSHVDANRAQVDARRAQLKAGSGATKTATPKKAKKNQKPTETVLTHEQQEKASQLATAMAEKYGVDAKDFSVVTEEDVNGKKKLTLLYAAVNGIDLGDTSKDHDARRSWNSIFDKKNAQNFMIEIDGKTIDTRSGMTRATYSAMITDAKARGIDSLPDSIEFSEIWANTWLTGEEAVRGGALLTYVHLGKVYDYNLDRADCGRNVLFRPTAVIE